MTLPDGKLIKRRPAKSSSVARSLVAASYGKGSTLHEYLTEMVLSARDDWHSEKLALTVERWRDSPEMVAAWTEFDSRTACGAIVFASVAEAILRETLRQKEDLEVAAEHTGCKSRKSGGRRLTRQGLQRVEKAARKLLEELEHNGMHHHSVFRFLNAEYGAAALVKKEVGDFKDDALALEWGNVPALDLLLPDSALSTVLAGFIEHLKLKRPQKDKRQFHAMPQLGTAQENGFTKLFLLEFVQGRPPLGVLRIELNQAMFRAIALLAKTAFPGSEITEERVRDIYRQTHKLKQ